MNRNLILVCLLLVFAGCSVSSENFPDRDKLKREIINNISIPVKTGDTLIYEPYFDKCGTWEDGELDRFYEPALNEQPYLELLKAHVNKTIIYTGDSAYDEEGKPTFTILGRAVTNSSVNIIERYNNQNEGVTIEKLFTYEGEKWKCRLIDKHEFAY